MHATTLSFGNMHIHGDLLVKLLKARRQTFIVERKWDLPEAEGMEYDQYDTPASRWIAIHEDGEVLAGIRLTPTTARCGMYSYMIRDAQKGMLEDIPDNLLNFEAPVDQKIWESSRVFVSRDIPADKRFQVQVQLMQELIKAARDQGAEQLLGMVPSLWPRWIRRLGLRAEPAGPVMEIEGMKVQVAMMDLNDAVH
ncbi:acyl-homoserine-lactone synthase [Shimia thalassica]|jgi:N-acyl-L-homoserine lactone synthetase|uniref:Isovaleryl-homoserine lactone synthase n=1 Tax=Shimia thalassica TaxID=1715693 RepID=A0A0P1I590_9RHOB|nr:acyl-homoserine-lactone synthase [Shimia thalassica]PHO03419.1 N-acyl-L-homoserine lactone synthetase [Rhodobacteraceae bacterium 4F10]MBU2944363.1 N-acyl-L-homoserine lactone synthetase [Shimia thalassica]MDO6479413.1 acyl-homoserine-lactone synthase [Shimia thalassica]MDO6482669.1 acyl-homoserine-lactone synthase [Shimia thalassica]MDO6502292.1 acyl-homoserine-lactone synthase [Shimia thalassica]